MQDEPFGNGADLTAVAARYDRFMATPVIRGFLADGGEVFIATDRRPWKVILTLQAQGHRHFAEKYVQEALAKWPAHAALPAGLRLHNYGRLQTNKAIASLRRFDGMESLDRPQLLARIAATADQDRQARKFHLQVNLGCEPQKGGVAPQGLEALCALARGAYGLNIAGLMAIPPRDDDPEPHFRWLRRMADRLHLAECVMGMTNDYEAAIRCGATAIRIGRAILGPLPPRIAPCQAE